MHCALRNFNKFIKINQRTQYNELINIQVRHLRALRYLQIDDNQLKAIEAELAEKNAEKEHQLQNQNNKGSHLAVDFGNREAHVPTFNLAAHVNNSMTLQQLISLGVNLHDLERRKGIGAFVLRLDFEQNVKPYLAFLADQGVSPDNFGHILTKNPLLFKVDIDDLNTRVEYLKSKQFSDVARQNIFTKNPYWLMFSTRRIDRRLGFFQNQFTLSGSSLRLLATKQPQVITYNMEHLRKSIFSMREEMGFNKQELRSLILQKPRLLMIPSDDLIERFSYAHNDMGLSHAQLLQCPEVLASREFRLRERHEFLKLLGRAQYDTQKDLYISPASIVQGNNFYFVRNVAKSDLQTFDLFLKTR